MARKTKQQMAEAQAKYQAERVEQERAEYFPLLMKTLEDATTAGFSMSVREGKFAVRNNDWVSWKDGYHLTPEYTEDNYNVLQDLKFDVDRQLFLLEEERQKAERRSAALAKLTDEERKLLNL
jgi:hypothetical protein